MQDIAQICPAERIRFDPARFQEMVQRHGAQGAERALNLALERIAVGVSRVERASRCGDPRAIIRDAAALAVVADEIGFTGLNHAAVAARDAAEWRDPIAVSATVARLVRVGEASLMSAWDIRGISL